MHLQIKQGLLVSFFSEALGLCFLGFDAMIYDDVKGKWSMSWKYDVAHENARVFKYLILGGGRQGYFLTGWYMLILL